VQLFEPIRLQLLELERGVKISWLNGRPGAPERVYGSLSVFVGDHVEQCEVSRHLGNRATMADRSCWIRREQFTDCSLDLWHPTMLRRKAQTAVIGDMLRAEAATKLQKFDDRKVRQALQLQAPGGELFPERPLFEESVMAPLRTKYGMRADARDPFEGLRFDPHLQCPRDPDHLLWFGIAKTLLEFAYDSFGEVMRESVSRRLLDFPWPSNYSRITFDLSRTIASRYSMAFVRKMFLLAVLTWDDLLPASHFELFAMFFRLCNLLLARSRSEPERRRLVSLTNDFVGKANKVLGDSLTQNWHNLLELVKKDLRLFPNLNLVRTSGFEAHHQGSLRC
jgi:hypothetical protein